MGLSRCGVSCSKGGEDNGYLCCGCGCGVAAHKASRA